MGLTNFEGFEGYSSYKDVARTLNMPSGSLFPGSGTPPISFENSTILYGNNVKNKNDLPNLKFLKVDTVSSNEFPAGFYTNNRYTLPVANVPFRKNIEHGIVGFSIFPSLPSGGSFGPLGDEMHFSPIAMITDSGYNPSLVISLNNSGQVILSHYNSTRLFQTNRLDMTTTSNGIYGATIFNSTGGQFGDANVVNFDSNGNFIDPASVTTMFSITPNSERNALSLLAPPLIVTPNTNNRLYFNYWNYIEIEFDLRNNREQFKIRINRNETSRKIDGSFGPFNSGLPLVSGVAQSGTLTNPAVATNGSSFTVLQDGNIKVVAAPYDNRFGRFIINNIAYGTGGGLGGGYDYLTVNIPVRKNTIVTSYPNGDDGGFGLNAVITNYIPRSRSLSNIAFGQMKFYGTSPFTTKYSTLIDDVYVIDCEDGLSPSGFLGPIACRKTNFNTTVTNTAGSGTLAQASETFAGTTSLLDSIIFDRLEQSGVFRNTSFSSSESGIKEEVIAIQNTTYGFSINQNDYVTYSVLQQGSGTPLRSGVLGTNRLDGGLLFSPIYTTLPNGVALSGLTSDSGIQELQYLFIAKSEEEE